MRIHGCPGEFHGKRALCVMGYRGGEAFGVDPASAGGGGRRGGGSVKEERRPEGPFVPMEGSGRCHPAANRTPGTWIIRPHTSRREATVV